MNGFSWIHPPVIKCGWDICQLLSFSRDNPQMEVVPATFDCWRVSLQAFVAVHMKLNWCCGTSKVETVETLGKSMASSIGFPKKSFFFRNPFRLERRRLVYGRRCEAEEKYLKDSWGTYMEASEVMRLSQIIRMEDHCSFGTHGNLRIPNLEECPI